MEISWKRLRIGFKGFFLFAISLSCLVFLNDQHKKKIKKDKIKALILNIIEKKSYLTLQKEINDPLVLDMMIDNISHQNLEIAVRVLGILRDVSSKNRGKILEPLEKNISESCITLRKTILSDEKDYYHVSCLNSAVRAFRTAFPEKCFSLFKKLLFHPHIEVKRVALFRVINTEVLEKVKKEETLLLRVCEDLVLLLLDCTPFEEGHYGQYLLSIGERAIPFLEEAISANKRPKLLRIILHKIKLSEDNK